MNPKGWPCSIPSSLEVYFPFFQHDIQEDFWSESGPRKEGLLVHGDDGPTKASVEMMVMKKDILWF